MRAGLRKSRNPVIDIASSVVPAIQLFNPPAIVRDDRAEEVNQLHADICAAGKSAITKALRLGKILSETKQNLDHGQWIPWLRAHVKFDERTAQRYMQLHENRSAINDSVSDLTAAYRLLRAPKNAIQKPAVEAAVVMPADGHVPDYKPSNGMTFAKMAICQLERIHPKDAEREQAAEHVLTWIASQRAEPPHECIRKLCLAWDNMGRGGFKKLWRHAKRAEKIAFLEWLKNLL